MPTTVIRRSRGNFSNSAKRAEDGRKGRGANALVPKATDEMAKIMKRIEAICQREQVNGEDGSAARLSEQLHAAHDFLKVKKF